MAGISKRRRTVILAAALTMLAAFALLSISRHPAHAADRASTECPGDNGGLTLSPGFCASVFADNLGHVRHIVVAPNGVVYANVWSGGYYPGDPIPKDGFLLALQDTTGDHHADKVTTFGETYAQGAHGGTGVGLYKNFVYAEVNDRIVRYRLAPGEVVPKGAPETVLSGLPTNGDHNMHPFLIDPEGRLFVDLGTATNSCQPKNRQPNIPGAVPCTELETRGGLWLYSANKLDQKFSPAERYVTGLRNAEGISLDAEGRMFATQHGRDQLIQNWPKLYPDVQLATNLPAEVLVRVHRGDDYGWPYCYYDGYQQKLVLAPEYGGDGGKTQGVCATKQAPVAAFPGHWAPNDMLIYKAAAFPKPYQGGAFIAFHGSWNKAPAPQAGYNIVYQPLKDGVASGDFVVFADGFAAGHRDPGRAKFRPMGLAVGPDGALYIADDVRGRIWRVTYHGARDLTGPAPAPEPAGQAPVVVTSIAARQHDIPPGSSPEQVAAGEKIYHSASCAGCHGGDAKGSPLGPDLTSKDHLWTDGSPAQITDVIAKGVPTPKRYRAPMPPMGGAQLSPADLAAVSAYVWAVGH
jgi:glucose/arabinose dehydrogenase/mono/diheme cytochrome c family protein